MRKRDGKDRDDEREQQEPAHEEERGRGAEKPGDISKSGWRDILKRTKNQLRDDNMTLVAAGVAFFLLVALVPGLIALISIYGLIADPDQVRQHFSAVSGILPSAVNDMLTQQMQRIAGNSQAASWGAALGILVALWTASSGMRKMIDALNIAYDEEERRGFFKLTMVTLALTLGAIAVGLIAIGVIVVLPAALKLVGLDDNQWIANLIRWPVLAVIALFALAILYRFAPNRAKPKWRWVTWGSVLAMALWVLGSAAFSFYVSNFGNYNETYGSLAAVVIMLLWLFLSTYVVLLGAELNAEMEHQTARDTTEEPERPRGRRGAHAADDLGEAYA